MIFSTSRSSFIKIDNKYKTILKIVNKHNDINDKDAMTIAGTTFSPSDAHHSIKAISNYVLKSKGGDGVIRELLDYLIHNKES